MLQMPLRTLVAVVLIVLAAGSRISLGETAVTASVRKPRKAKKQSLGPPVNQSVSSRAGLFAPTCCCKHVEEQESCPLEDKTKLGGLRYYHPAEGKCCKFVKAMFGCYFYGGYAAAEDENACKEDVRELEPPKCCQATAEKAFFVTKVFREDYSPRATFKGDGSIPTERTNPTVFFSPDYISGATFKGDLVEAEEAIDHLKNYARDPTGGYACRQLTDSETCEIAAPITSLCCCPRQELWSDDACIPAEEPFQKMVTHESAQWQMLLQTYTKCVEHVTVDKDVRESYQQSYQGTCTRTKTVMAPPPIRMRRVTERYSCTKKRTAYRTVKKPERKCVREEDFPYCPTDGQGHYRRVVPKGQCRAPETLVSSDRFSQPECPAGEIPGGFVTEKRHQCRCDSCG